MDRGAWQAAVHGVTRVGHDWATTPLPPCASAAESTKQMLLVARGGRGDPGPKTAGEARLESRTQTVLHLHFHLTGIIIKPSALPNSAWQGYSCSAFSPSAIFYTWLLLFPFFFFFFYCISHGERGPQQRSSQETLGLAGKSIGGHWL